MQDLVLSCDCGKVYGKVSQFSKKENHRVICHCKSCQAFAHSLGKEGESTQVLDDYGGTEAYMLAPNQLSIERGLEHLRCRRMSKGGPDRWYADCCKAALGNYVSQGFEMFNLIHNSVDFSPIDKPVIRAYLFNKSGVKVPESRLKVGMPLGFIVSSFLVLLRWKVSGKSRPNPLYDADNRPISAPELYRA